MSVKDFFMRKMMGNALKGVPQDAQDKLFSAIQKNPDLFKKIADEVSVEMKSGKDQMSATMNVVKKYESELKGVL